jgi:hypothetical protein
LDGAATALEQDPYAAQLRLEQTLLSGDVSKQTHDTIEQQMVTAASNRQGNATPVANQGAIVGLLLGSPEFQRK